MTKLLGTIKFLTEFAKKHPGAEKYILPCPADPSGKEKPDWKFWSPQYNAAWVIKQIIFGKENCYLFGDPEALIEQVNRASRPDTYSKCTLGMEVYLLLLVGYQAQQLKILQDGQPVIALMPPQKLATHAPDIHFQRDLKFLNLAGYSHFFWTEERVDIIAKGLAHLINLEEEYPMESEISYGGMKP